MKILWFSWKDIRHPLAGGAELVMHELAKRLVADGHEVTILTAAYSGAPAVDTIEGISIIRKGANRYMHSFAALAYAIRHLRHQFDVVIESINTAPYFSTLLKGKARHLLFYHQLAREIWYFETKFPLAQIGYYVLEPMATFLLGKSRSQVVTVSNSTKQDLVRFGFSPQKIRIVSEGIHITPLADLESVEKYPTPTLLSMGAIRPMKRTLDQIKAFEIAKKTVPQLRLKISGDANGKYGQEVLACIQKSKYRKDIEYLGRVSDAQKIELMQRCHLTLQTAIKEGWGLTITEAASQGCPAVVYDVDGLRDSVRSNETGIITKPHPEALAQGIVKALKKEHYENLRTAAWQWSKEITFEQCYADMMDAIKGETRL
jgi:glycosyltransferase involved in cell wall biosynthesis